MCAELLQTSVPYRAIRLKGPKHMLRCQCGELIMLKQKMKVVEPPEKQNPDHTA